MKNFCEYLREQRKNEINSEKKKNATVNKKRPKIISRCNGILHL